MDLMLDNIIIEKGKRINNIEGPSSNSSEESILKGSTVGSNRESDQ